MAVSIRLQRRGKKKLPFYSIVAADRRSCRDGKFLEKLGYYDPNQEPSLIKIDVDRMQHWYGKGAIISDAVAQLAKVTKLELSRKA